MGLKRYLRNLFRHDRNTRQLFDELKTKVDSIPHGEYIARQVKENIRTQYMQDKVMSTTEMGISSTKLCEHEVVVSLTTHGIRIHNVCLAIESIMQGSVKPNRIVLWLSEEEFKGKLLPISLQNQVKRGLQIEYCRDIRSFKKLIPSLKMFPEACIVTIDDDVIYDFDLVENLIKTHIENPTVVCANRIHRLELSENKMPISYIQWQWGINDYMPNKLNFFTGVGGVLYPPNIFLQEVFNESVFMDICEFADDVWFNAMLMLNKVSIIKSYTHSLQGEDYVEISDVKYVGLCNENVNSHSCRNDIQIKAVWDKYKLNELF